MIRVVCLLVFAMTGICAQAQKKVASPQATLEQTVLIQPEVLHFAHTEYDFGKIPQGRPVYHTFVFTNTGKVPAVISDVRASCGCTTPEWSREPIPAGDTAVIKVGFNAGDEGPFARPIFITYNNDHTVQLMVKGEVWKTPVRSAPENTIVNKLNKKQSL